MGTGARPRLTSPLVPTLQALGHLATVVLRERYLGVRIPGVRVYGPELSRSGVTTAPIVSVSVKGLPSADVARILDKEFDIAARAGLHCAPEAHGVAGTLDTGLVRLSPGHATTESDIDATIDAFIKIIDQSAERWQKGLERQHAR